MTTPPSTNYKKIGLLLVGFLLVVVAFLVVLTLKKSGGDATSGVISTSSVETDDRPKPQPLSDTAIIFDPEQNLFIDYGKSFPLSAAKVDGTAPNARIADGALWVVEGDTLSYEKSGDPVKTRKVKGNCSFSATQKPALLCFKEKKNIWVVEQYGQGFIVDSVAEVKGDKPVGQDSDGNQLIAGASDTGLSLQSAVGERLNIPYGEFGDIRPVEIIYAQEGADGFLIVVANYQEQGSGGGYIQKLWAVAVNQDGKTVDGTPLSLSDSSGSITKGGDGSLWLGDETGIQRVARTPSGLKSSNMFEIRNSQQIVIRINETSSGVAVLLMSMRDGSYSGVDLSADE